MRADALARVRAAARRKDAERGRPLTAREKLDNLARWLATTPDRSGEADKTGTGLAEGESGLPEGPSK